MVTGKNMDTPMTKYGEKNIYLNERKKNSSNYELNSKLFTLTALHSTLYALRSTLYAHL
jgi:hypothetical protein